MYHYMDLGTKDGYRSDPAHLGNFCFLFSPHKFRIYWGVFVLSRGVFLSEDVVKVSLNVVIAPACHFRLFITPDRQETEGAALLAEVSSPDDHEDVGLLLIIGIGRHVWMWSSGLWCFSFQ